MTALIGNILISLLVLQLVWQYIARFGRDTIGNEQVPTYYQNHGIREIVLSFTLAALMLVFSWMGESTFDLIMLTIAGVGLVGCYWIAVACVGLGRQFQGDDSDDIVPHVNHAIQVLVLCIALVLKWTG
tara:strand:+ start:248 stop:634 length:387 start_codon:yes stop_codon:yes gene_type:complete